MENESSNVQFNFIFRLTAHLKYCFAWMHKMTFRWFGFEKLSNQLKSLRRYTTPLTLKDLIYCRLHQKKSISNHTGGWYKLCGNVILECKFQKKLLDKLNHMQELVKLYFQYKWLLLIYCISLMKSFYSKCVSRLKKIKPFSIWKLKYKYELIYLQCVWRSCFCLKHFIESGKYIVLLT